MNNNDGDDGDGDREDEVPMCVIKRVGEDQAEELSVAASAAEAEVANNPDNEDDVEDDNEDESNVKPKSYRYFLRQDALGLKPVVTFSG